ncbi:hypothetical protein [Pelomonas sp. Root1444]|uniref:hypothetical protein n=1 Tax=Pelomonas sp. Root1444 TaxID=1736464 RepID=UPI0012FC4863|nr:hypothetical protein [Pelomonas sp. Root1444]
MKRVQIAPGKFVTISPELAEKVAHLFATGLTRDQVREIKAAEPRFATGLMLGSSKPLALARLRTGVSTAVAEVSVSAPASSVTVPADEPAGEN